MEHKIINKVALSGIININLETFYPKGERVLFDIKERLFEGLILREKDFRAFIKNEDWSAYQDKYVALICSEDAIVPTWAYMLLATHLTPFVKKVVFGDLETLETVLYHELLNKLPIHEYKDARIVIKGCGDLPVPNAAYVEITRLLRPVAKSIMYGEACSMVPLYKQPKLPKQSK
ncbi:MULTISPECIES: DUF2480 family protein [unclassified Polaribacter]|uniref:DUF2480 family protein n=1 Tax=unclassified Polaribacter TaxID=196858 RepID=UPI0011BD4FAC|nr:MULTISPECIES: DUF2480 family protein [unclassified Polaribacter]TXD50236.1 DUF2480 family protein [Polaribacter sp. IC063]TXD56299.1 DUF2480 family protein [Polaribacter sp. IC066]